MQVNIKSKAQAYFSSGQPDKARPLYEKALKKNPKDAESLYMLGAICGQKGNFRQAIKYFRKTLDLYPGNFIALCGLGKAQKEAGDFHDAESSFTRASEIQPNNLDVLLELAGVLLHLGKLDDAENLLNKVLTLSPDNTEAMHGLGEIYQSRRQYDMAIGCYNNVLNRDPNRTNTHNRLGFALHTIGSYFEAIDHYKRAVSLNGQFREAYINLATTQITVGQTEDAQTTLNKARMLWPDSIDFILSNASLLEKTGDTSGAYSLIKPLLDKNTRHPMLGIVYLAICKKVEACDSALEYMEGLISESGQAEKTLETMHYAIGDVYDSLGRYDEAFSHIDRANRLRPRTFSKFNHELFIDSLINVFSPAHFSRNSKSTITRKRPVFIVGMPRSGTSLVEQILDSHSHITGAGELNNIGRIAQEIQCKPGQKQEYPYNCSELTAGILDAYASRYYSRLDEISASSEYVTDKMPHNFLHLGLISELLPASKIIHCSRDPLDTCLSVYFQNFHEKHDYASNLEDVANYYKSYRKLMDHWKTVLGTGIYEISYDALVRDPEPEIRGLLEYLELEWEDKCLDFHTSRRYVPTASYNQVRKRIYKSSSNRWKNYESHIQPLIEILAPDK